MVHAPCMHECMHLVRVRVSLEAVCVCECVCGTRGCCWVGASERAVSSFHTGTCVVHVAGRVWGVVWNDLHDSAHRHLAGSGSGRL